jgi:hypothetical protein
LKSCKRAEIDNVHRKRAGADLRIAWIKINDFRRRSAVSGFSTWYDRPRIIAFVHVKVVVGQA